MNRHSLQSVKLRKMKLRKMKLRKVKLSVTHAYVRSAFRHRCRVSLAFFLLTAAHSPFFLHIAVRTLVFFAFSLSYFPLVWVKHRVARVNNFFENGTLVPQSSNFCKFIRERANVFRYTKLSNDRKIYNLITIVLSLLILLRSKNSNTFPCYILSSHERTKNWTVYSAT